MSAPFSLLVLRVLLVMVTSLILIDSTLNVLQFVMGRDRVFGLVNLMDLGRERSLPTWYASMQLAAAGILLSVIAVAQLHRRAKHGFAWSVLALGFFFMSYDEVAEVHEGWGRLVADQVPQEGIFYFRWVAVAIPLCIVLLFFFLGLIRSMSANLRKGSLISAVVFVGGAVGLEMVSGYVVDVYGVERETLAYSMLNVVENGMELLGISIFIYVLLRYISEELHPSLSLVGSSPHPGTATGMAGMADARGFAVSRGSTEPLA